MFVYMLLITSLHESITLHFSHKWWEFPLSRRTNLVEELVSSKLSATATSATASTTACQDDPQGSSSIERGTNAEGGSTEIQAEETAGLGQHDERSWERHKAQTRQVQWSKRAPDREGEQGHGRSSRWSSNPLRSLSGAHWAKSTSFVRGDLFFEKRSQ